MFRQVYLCEGIGNLYWMPGYVIWKWSEADVFVSLIRDESALFCHFAASGEGVRRLKQAINEFCCKVFDDFPWCFAVMACITLESVVRLVRKCNFSHVIDHDYLKVYARYRT
ncbi:hypothetical protein AH02_10 [Pseudomonas phage AH02]|nr:hypothetical protein AH02_10 [Pseudomonas phage AH02]